MLKTRQMCNLE